MHPVFRTRAHHGFVYWQDDVPSFVFNSLLNDFLQFTGFLRVWARSRAHFKMEQDGQDYILHLAVEEGICCSRRFLLVWLSSDIQSRAVDHAGNREQFSALGMGWIFKTRGASVSILEAKPCMAKSQGFKKERFFFRGERRVPFWIQKKKITFWSFQQFLTPCSGFQGCRRCSQVHAPSQLHH